LALGAGTLANKSLEIAQKLDLHRLCAHATLATMAAPPTVAGAPLLAVAEIGSNVIGVAAPHSSDATPGPYWGLGQEKPLIYGAIDASSDLQIITADHLIALSVGNARFLRLQNELDGSVADFGARFWRTLEELDPLTIAALKQNGVSEAVYRDRYLLTPLNFRLLHEVLGCLPGKAGTTTIEISTAQLERFGQAGHEVYHTYTDDRNRRAVIERLFPRATVSIIPKAQQPHARSLELKLNDGRRLQVLLDQGFGAWRADGSARHDFRLPADKQAEQIKKAAIRLRMSEKYGSPVIMRFL
jgi:hypothetical protein